MGGQDWTEKYSVYQMDAINFQKAVFHVLEVRREGTKTRTLKLYWPQRKKIKGRVQQGEDFAQFSLAK